MLARLWRWRWVVALVAVAGVVAVVAGVVTSLAGAVVRLVVALTASTVVAYVTLILMSLLLRRREAQAETGRQSARREAELTEIFRRQLDEYFWAVCEAAGVESDHTRVVPPRLSADLLQRVRDAGSRLRRSVDELAGVTQDGAHDDVFIELLHVIDDVPSQILWEDSHVLSRLERITWKFRRDEGVRADAASGSVRGSI
jgi:hypothetical protein